MRPVWIAFDLNGTLVDPCGLTGDERGPAVLDAAIQQSMADGLSGAWRPFGEYVGAALERELGEEADPGTMPALPGAAEALDTLRAAGYRVAVVTNSAADAARATLAAAGLEGRVDALVGTDGVGAYKPDPRVYANAVVRLGAEPGAVCLASAHAWDVLGAMRAGWQGAWVGHREGRLLSTVPAPLVSAPTLFQAAEQLAALA